MIKEYTYKGSFFFSFWGIILTLHVIILLYAGLIKHNYSLAIIGSVIWIALGVFQMFYFKISGKYIIILNHLLPWFKRSYFLPDVAEIIFEDNGRAPNQIRLIMADSKSHGFSAATLSDNTWRKLAAKLRSRKVVVRNELKM